MKRIAFVFATTFLIASCGSPSEDSTNSTDAAAFQSDTHVLLDIADTGFEMGLPVPKDIAVNHIPIARFNDASGVMEIEAGPAFQIDITEELTSLDALKNNLRSDQLFTWKFSEESDDGFVAQAVLPTGESYYYHFFYLKTIGEQSYLMRSREGSTFTLASVHTMRASAQALISNP